MELNGTGFFLCHLDFSKCFLGSSLLYGKVNSLAVFASVSKSSCLLTSSFSFNQKHRAEPYLDEMLLICYLFNDFKDNVWDRNLQKICCSLKGIHVSRISCE